MKTPIKYHESHPHTLVLYLLSWMFDQSRIIVLICWLWVTQLTVIFWEVLVTWPTSFFVTAFTNWQVFFFFMQNVKGFWHSIHSYPKYPYLSCVALTEWFNKRWVSRWWSDLSSAPWFDSFPPERRSQGKGLAWMLTLTALNTAGSCVPVHSHPNQLLAFNDTFH